MGLVELDISLTEEQKTLRNEARKFLMEVWRPAAIKLDKLADPADVIAKGSLLWDVFRESYRLGYNKLRFPKAVGGLELDPMAGTLISEEMGYAAADFAIGIGVAAFPFNFALMSADPSVQSLTRQYCDDTEAKVVGCWAITEPEHGSDWLLWQGEQTKNPKVTPQVRGVKKGNDYIINGQKSAWVSNGTIATHAALFFSVEPSVGMEHCAIAVVPLNLPGVSRGKPLNKLGQRALNQGEIFFDDVRVPAKYVVCSDPAQYAVISDATLASANAGMGTCFVGLAAAALDEAIAYCKQRVQGGKIIFEHQSVKARLFDMFISVEAARSLARRVVMYNRVVIPPALHYSIASKIMATEAAFRVASQAIQLFGGYGLTKDFHIEKIFRDARAAMIEDGVNETLALAGADKLR